MFANGGVFAAVVTLLIAAWVACDNMIVLIKLAEYTGKNSYGQVCQHGCFFITLFYYRTGPLIRNRVFLLASNFLFDENGCAVQKIQ